jgi:hypothetical protein
VVPIQKETKKECMMKYLILILTLVSLTANAQVPMTTDNHSLGPGTYEESMAQINGALPPSGGYTKGWQTSKPGTSMSYGGATGTVPLPNNPNDVPDD